MVMDVAPSPQCVGREFVRQYYTLLNEAPQFLHRFYSNNSSFIHGGEAKPDGEEQTPVIGQANIHTKIMSLNFQDCHAKIRYVDSQLTIATGVVVQVTGELSNNQAPLRRFMQTFVLAPQTPNKYYVHNDIFRYQDEVFADSDEEDELVEEDSKQAPSKQPAPEEAAEPSETHADNNAHLYHQQMLAEQQRELQQQMNGRVLVGVAEPVITNGHKQEAATPPPPVVQPEEPELSSSAPSSPEPVADARPEQPVAGRVEVHPPTHQQPPPEESAVVTEAPKQPKSWAKIAHVSGGAHGAITSHASSVPVGTHVSTSQSQQGAFPGHPAEQAAPSVEKPGPTTHRVQPMRNNRPRVTLADQRAFGDTTSGNKPARSEDTPHVEERRPEKPKYPDSQQVFVGNLPQNITDFELRDYFKEHGKVLEVRVNRNSPNKLNFGFVVFDSEAVAQTILGMKSLELRGNRLNIEEKKPRSDNRTHSNSRHGGRRDGPRHMRGRGFNNPPRGDDHDGRQDHGRFNNVNKSNQHRR